MLSTSEFPTDYTVIDIETTGLSPDKNNIIELSDKAYLVKRNKKFGVVYADGTVAIPVEGTEFKHTNSIVIITDCINGTTYIFSTTCNRYFKLCNVV